MTGKEIRVKLAEAVKTIPPPYNILVSMLVSRMGDPEINRAYGTLSKLITIIARDNEGAALLQDWGVNVENFR